MRLKIAIVDDEETEREHVASLTREWVGKSRHTAEIALFPDAKSFFFAYEEKRDYDFLLLDVGMPGENGIELAKRIRRENRLIQIVFITGFYEYFSDGYDVSALHYLIKPVDEAKLFPVLDRAENNLAFRERSVLVSDGDGTRKLPLADLIYAESENVMVKAVGVDGTYHVRTTLQKFQEELDGSFLRVHRSYLVNLKYVKKITRRDVLMANGDLIPISRGNYDEVYQALIRTL